MSCSVGFTTNGIHSKDEGLDVIGEGLATLENMASDMNEELDRHVLVQASSLDG